MADALLAELRDLIARHVVASGAPLAALPNILLGREDGPTLPCIHVTDPVFSLIAQGTKQIEVGDRTLTYGPGEGMAVSIELPMNSFVIGATAEQPFLGVGLRIRPEAVAALLLEQPGLALPAGNPASVMVGTMPDALIEAVVRLLRLLDHPADLPVLAPAMEREILWRVLSTPQGAVLRQIGLADSHTARIGRALQWLRSHLAEPIRVSVLAQIAGMSLTSFHRHFRAITAMTPVQYQKQLRLHAARARLLASAESVTLVAFAVGYESPSQFSREYRRQYGQPPARDGRLCREAASA
ncbi:AraC family transcriptional regulator [Novosphingobium terrae]|uniref:AraC family transcriptional regulator n=1 Tax=Novosphingobium terrae TaxID=2726189 RepID=UPI00197D2414|nr:AraC family transcriptional regulator [Novosphingobium terrae]